MSPDGSQAFVVTRTAKVANDVNRFEILLLDLNSGRLAASAPGAAVRVFSVESRNDDDDANPSLREVRWHGHRSLVFRARLHDEPFQVYQLDVLTQRLTQLTYAPLGVLSFDVSGDSRRVVYVAPVPNPCDAPWFAQRGGGNPLILECPFWAGQLSDSAAPLSVLCGGIGLPHGRTASRCALPGERRWLPIGQHVAGRAVVGLAQVRAGPAARMGRGLPSDC